MSLRLIFMDPRASIPHPVPPPKKSILCLGSFDGVHIAHAALMREGIARAKAMSTPLEPVLCGVFCFLRPSVDFVTSEDTPNHLTTLKEKLALIGEIGVDFVCLCEFPDIRDLSPAEFIAMIRERCGCIGTMCGFNFRFGKGAAGNTETLKAAFGDNAHVVEPMYHNGEIVSASLIRKTLLDGNIETANALLGYPYSLSASVVHGKKLGRQLGFPTANQYFPAERLIPRHGVYAVLCRTPYGVEPGVSNVGHHPTVDKGVRINCETYIAGFTGNLYARGLTVEFRHYLRPEMRFDSIEDLANAIRRDAAQAMEMLGNQK